MRKLHGITIAIVTAAILSGANFYVLHSKAIFAAHSETVKSDEIQEVVDAASRGEAAAQYQLGYFYETGKDVPRDYMKAAEWYRKAADQKYPDAQNNIGSLYERGLGVPQDTQEARRWYQLAVDQGFPNASANLGRLYDAGIGVEVDRAEALKWYQKAADAGFAPAKTYIGLAYRDGTLVRRDYAKAVALFQEAADAGDVYGLSNLAEMYKLGLGVEKDLLKSGSLYGDAANAEFEEAKYFLEAIYARCPVKPVSMNDLTEAQTEACLIGAGAGHASSLHIAGQIFFWGHGISKNNAKAVELTQKAVDQGYEPAKADLAILKTFDNKNQSSQ